METNEKQQGKSKKLWMILLLLLLVATSIIAGIFLLGKSKETANYSIGLDQRDIVVNVGETAKVSLSSDKEYNSLKAETKWISSATGIATVDENGTVTGVSGGEAKVSAVVKYAGREYTASCIVTVKEEGMKYSSYQIHWYTQRKDRSGYEVEGEIFERIPGSKVELTVQDAKMRIPSQYVLNKEKSILTGTVKGKAGACVLEVYYDVAEISYSMDYYYESDTNLGTYVKKETKNYKAYAFSEVSPGAEAQKGFKLNLDKSLLEKESVTSGTKLKAYYDRIRSKVTIKYPGTRENATYTNVYGVGLLDAPEDVFVENLSPYNVGVYINGKLQDDIEGALKKRTSDTTVCVDVKGEGFTYSAKTGTLLNESTAKKISSYTYLQGKDSTIYLSANYNLTGSQTNLVGITIKSGDESRQVLFSGQGVAVFKNHENKSGVIDGSTYKFKSVDNNGIIIAQNSAGLYGSTVNSAVKNMVSNKDASSHEVIWTIWEGTLYSSVDGEVVVRLPLSRLCESWTADSVYRIGFAAWDTAHSMDEMSISNVDVKFGKNAEAVLKTKGEVAGLTDVYRQKYDPISGTYIASSAGKGSYLYGTESAENSGITANVKWMNKDNTGSSVGVTVKVDGETVQYYIGAMNEWYRRTSSYTWGAGTNLKMAQIAPIIPFNENGECKLGAYVKDGYFYITYNGEQAHCINLLSLFPSYTKESDVSVGICTWDAYLGQAMLSDVQILNAAKVNNVELTKWDFYSEAKNNASVDYANGTITYATSKWNEVTLLGSSKSWHVKGTMKRGATESEALMYMGFEIRTDDGTYKRILGNEKGFSIGTGNKTYAAGSNKYAFGQSQGTFFTEKTDTDEVAFDMILYKDILYVYFDGELSWRIPLTAEELNFGFVEGSDYTVKFRIGDQNVEGSVENLKVLMGWQVEEETDFMTYEGATYSLAEAVAKTEENVARWESINNLYWKGNLLEKISSEGVTKNHDYAYFPDKSDSIYLEVTQEMLTNNCKGFMGISIKHTDEDGTAESREVVFVGEGIGILCDNSWTQPAHLRGNAGYDYNAPGQNGNYVWSQSTANNIISKMRANTEKDDYKVVWAITDGTLYGSIDGFVFLSIPLTQLSTAWTAEDEYQIGLVAKGPSANGYVTFKNIDALYGDEAKTKLVTEYKLAENQYSENNNFTYEALEGTFTPHFAEGVQSMYGIAGSADQALTTTIVLEVGDSIASSNGILLKSGDEALILQLDQDKNQITLWKGSQCVGHIDYSEYSTNGLFVGGKCEIAVVVKDTGVMNLGERKLLLTINGTALGAVSLSELLDDYSEGADVALGIYAEDANKGLARFAELCFLGASELDTITTSDADIQIQYAKSGTLTLGEAFSFNQSTATYAANGVAANEVSYTNPYAADKLNQKTTCYSNAYLDGKPVLLTDEWRTEADVSLGTWNIYGNPGAGFLLMDTAGNEYRVQLRIGSGVLDDDIKVGDDCSKSNMGFAVRFERIGDTSTRVDITQINGVNIESDAKLKLEGDNGELKVYLDNQLILTVNASGYTLADGTTGKKSTYSGKPVQLGFVFANADSKLKNITINQGNEVMTGKLTVSDECEDGYSTSATYAANGVAVNEVSYTNPYAADKLNQKTTCYSNVYLDNQPVLLTDEWSAEADVSLGTWNYFGNPGAGFLLMDTEGNEYRVQLRIGSSVLDNDIQVGDDCSESNQGFAVRFEKAGDNTTQVDVTKINGKAIESNAKLKLEANNGELKVHLDNQLLMTINASGYTLADGIEGSKNKTATYSGNPAQLGFVFANADSAFNNLAINNDGNALTGKLTLGENFSFKTSATYAAGGAIVGEKRNISYTNPYAGIASKTCYTNAYLDNQLVFLTDEWSAEADVSLGTWNFNGNPGAGFLLMDTEGNEYRVQLRIGSSVLDNDIQVGDDCSESNQGFAVRFEKVGDTSTRVDITKINGKEIESDAKVKVEANNGNLKVYLDNQLLMTVNASRCMLANGITGTIGANATYSGNPVQLGFVYANANSTLKKITIYDFK